MFESIINELENGKYGLSVNGYFAGEFDTLENAYKELQSLINYEIKANC
jgi:hypothetical protein